MGCHRDSSAMLSPIGNCTRQPLLPQPQAGRMLEMRQALCSFLSPFGDLRNCHPEDPCERTSILLVHFPALLPFPLGSKAKQSKTKSDLCFRKKSQRGPAVSELRREALPRLGSDKAHLHSESSPPCQVVVCTNLPDSQPWPGRFASCQSTLLKSPF